MTDSVTTSPSTRDPLQIGAETLLLFAVEELDLHISELISTGNLSISAIFHDWVADSLTTKIEAKLLAAHETSRFKDSLQLGDARTVVGHWVKHWACMDIKKHFAQYVQFCPCSGSSIARHMTVAATPPHLQDGSLQLRRGSIFIDPHR